MPTGVEELLHDRILGHVAISPSDALALIQRGRVTLNGRVQKTNRWVDAAADITVNGHSLEDLASLAVIAHKPARCSLTEGDPLKRPTYTKLLPDPSVIARPVGNVDFGASGLLVIANHRGLLQVLGEGNLDATFVVRLHELIRRDRLELLVAMLPDILCSAGIGVLPEHRAQVSIEKEPSDIHEGIALRVTVNETWPVQLRQALVNGLTTIGVHSRTTAPLRASICCVRLGPLSIEEPALQEPGSFRPLSEEEFDAVMSEKCENAASAHTDVVDQRL